MISIIRQKYFLNIYYSQVLFYRKVILGPKNCIVVSVLNRFYCKDLTSVPPVLAKSVPSYIKLSAVKGVCYIDILLY